MFRFVLFVFIGDTKVLVAVYGPKAGTKKNDNPEKACIEIIWKPKTGLSGGFLQIYLCLLLPLSLSQCFMSIL